MIPVSQTKFGGIEGNCVQACLASVLELPLDAVPNFVTMDDWCGEMEKWLLKLYGLQPLFLKLRREIEVDDWRPFGYHLMGGMGPRGLKHSVVGYRGEIKWDPHPDRGGLVKVEDWTVFVATMDGLFSLQRWIWMV